MITALVVCLINTISSLHIGQTMRELAAATAWLEPCSSRATLAVISSFSVDIGVLDVWLLNDNELAEGDRAAVLRKGGFGCAGDRDWGAAGLFPGPRLRPRVRLAAMLHYRPSCKIIF
jgi:hypothetical protein